MFLEGGSGMTKRDVWIEIMDMLQDELDNKENSRKAFEQLSGFILDDSRIKKQLLSIADDDNKHVLIIDKLIDLIKCKIATGV